MVVSGVSFLLTLTWLGLQVADSARMKSAKHFVGVETSFAESSVGGDRSSLASSVQSHEGGRSTDGRSTDLPEVSAATQRLQRVGSSRTAQLHAAGGVTSPPVFAQVASLGRVVSVSSCAGASGDAVVAVDVDAELRRPSVEPPGRSVDERASELIRGNTPAVLMGDENRERSRSVHAYV